LIEGSLSEDGFREGFHKRRGGGRKKLKSGVVV
jgi:hypothetical protein